MLDYETSKILHGGVTRKQITKVLSTILDDKAPIADGSSSFFFKATLKTVGDNFVKAIQYFFKTRRMLQEVNSTCITLVPKCPSPTSFGDYCPIACRGVVNMCITKILTHRMKSFIPNVVSLNQHALFHEGIFRIIFCYPSNCYMTTTEVRATKMGSKVGPQEGV